MESAVRARLLEINRHFYARHADDFSATRGRAWPGWLRAVPHVPERVLDLGCGNGRFLRYLLEHPERERLRCYVGTDLSLELLGAARRMSGCGSGAHFVRHDLETPLRDVLGGCFDLVVLFGVLHHVPGRSERARLLTSAAATVAPSGRLVCTAWQFQSDRRLLERRIEWPRVGLVDDDVEPGDHLLRWGGSDDPSAVRYCHVTTARELRALAASAGLRVERTFRADGRGGRLNLYAELRPEPLQPS